MNTEIKFSIESLLSKDRNGKIDCPAAERLFAEKMTAKSGDQYNRLARLTFEDKEILQQKQANELTIYDHLIIAEVTKDDLWLSLWIDDGSKGTPVAMCFESDDNLIITLTYEKSLYARKLSEAEIRQVFEYLFENPHELDILPMQG